MNYTAARIKAARDLHPDYTPQQVADLVGCALDYAYRFGWGLTLTDRVRQYLELHPRAESQEIESALGMQREQVWGTRSRLKQPQHPKVIRVEPRRVPPERSRPCVHVEAHQLRFDRLWHGTSRSFALQYSRIQAINIAWGDGEIGECERCR